MIRRWLLLLTALAVCFVTNAAAEGTEETCFADLSLNWVMRESSPNMV